jgi:hypothetical protein
MDTLPCFDFTGSVGIAEVDITPPVGIYNRCWGASEHRTATGIHMPFSATALVIGDDTPLVVIGFDAAWWQDLLPDACIARIAKTVGTDTRSVLLCMSHTHAGIMLSTIDPELPGAALHAEYVETLYDKLYDLAVTAASNRQPATIQSTYGQCNLARNRDQTVGDAVVTGHNPKGQHDDVLFAARIVSAQNECLGVIVNYACHPTTLAWENSLLSPDYIGTLRSTVYDHLKAPIIFLQGQSGDLSPAHGFVGDVAVAEKHGRQLGFAILSALESLVTPGNQLQFRGVKKSGADLGPWDEVPAPAATAFAAGVNQFDWPIRDGLATTVQLRANLETETDNAEVERIGRRIKIRELLGEGASLDVKCWTARFGNILLVAASMECYSQMQRDLRAAFPEFTIICINICNGWAGYVIPEADYAIPTLYPGWQTPLAPGIFEAMQDCFLQGLGELTDPP